VTKGNLPAEQMKKSGAPNGRERVKILEENCARRTSRFQRSCSRLIIIHRPERRRLILQLLNSWFL